MSETVNLPALGESVTEGTVTRWLKQVGDTVAVDEPLLEVSTDKVDTEIPSPVAGVIEEILVAEDETAEVGEALVRIGDGSGSSSDDSGSAPAQEEAPEAEEAPAEPEAKEEAPEAPAEDSGSADSGDSTDVTLPALGESVTEGTVTRWLKAVGDDVAVDEPLLEVSTDKVDTEIPSPVAGKLLEIKVNEDETAEVGSVLAVIGSGSSAPAKAAPKEAEPVAAAPSTEREEPVAEPKEEAPKQEAPKQEAPKEAAPKQEAPKEETGKEESGSGTYVTPLVRKLANEHGVDLSTVKGSGVAGRIRKQDVLDAAEAAKAKEPAPAAAPSSSDKAAPAKISEESAKLRGTTVKAPRIRQTIARRMMESLDTSAQLTQVQEVDMTRIATMRQKAKAGFKEQNGANLTFLPFIAKAVVEALKAHPKLNASYDSESQEITYHDAEHLAIAVDTEKGLLVPVINDAGDLNLAGLAKKIADVGARTRSGKIGPDELSGGTFTITNIGSVGALFDTPIINQPQVGILGTGAIVKRPVVRTDEDGNDTIAIRSMMYLSLTYDHRLVDGADAGRFLQTLKARLEEGSFEADLGL
ncbi:2-oxoglutarate dehydrogenase, E2 component, dihydrolipoamide succinyltransferase [Arthrobacter koreensis]|uniref:Dihydrolipoamide acetyltransferase component of pyruvate dehydrogenase complex n=3 Tax=Arthrobacter koreensis TaxID=199136 RepID=A0ABY6FW59_9MICC|nr:2-oxoglutarate dehydrogenase, E2 component, dihydrolipoamide succinyltransferase [Arthrobacter koreensis]MEB7447465.1 2-oxoglutarate dehydrogenase, E2 component, dihydrolipoamide succinyltransferase [Arthrobacter koreensis]UYB37350.1 2-oxoglutarate dehydrogenase, E2 component, dihydrolipoamide succinyltransferase [Arthrobacter koreensis]